MRVRKTTVMVVLLVVGLCCLFIPTRKQSLSERRLSVKRRQTKEIENETIMGEDEEERWKRRTEILRGDNTKKGGGKEEEENRKNEEWGSRSKREEEAREYVEKEKSKREREDTKGRREGGQEGGKSRGGGGGGGRKKNTGLEYWAEEMEEYSPSSINVVEMRKEMEVRRRRLRERCEETFTAEERAEVNSSEFLISKKYKLIWCNIFKSASSTWMYNYLRMAGKSPGELRSLRKTPVEAARELYPRPSPEELLAHLGEEGRGEGYLSFLIVRDPFQRFVSAYRDKIEAEVPYYKPLRCEITKNYPTASTWNLIARNTCRPTFSQFVSYVIGEEAKGRPHNEHWAPYYRFCSTCSVNFDLVLRFESLYRDEVYLLHEVAGLSQVVSSKVMHSSHTNYTTATARYFQQLSPKQVLGLLKLYLPDFRLFGYDERLYLNYVL